jgi:glutamate synthase (NADPH/NADH) small chain
MESFDLKKIEEDAQKLLSTYENVDLSLKDRLKIPIQPMPSQDPKERINNMDEVALGYTESQVKIESLRCIDCKNAPCIKGCPVGNLYRRAASRFIRLTKFHLQ